MPGRGYGPGWNARYTTDLTAPVGFYLRGEEYSAQLDTWIEPSWISTGSMTAAVDRLEEKGLLRRTSAPGDRRVKVLKLTRAGRRVVETAYGRHAAELESAMSVLNPTEKRDLRATLKKLGLFAAGVGAETDPRAQEGQ